MKVIADMTYYALLVSARLPEVSVDEETGKTEVDLKTEKKLQLSCRPIALTTAIFDESVHLFFISTQMSQI
jgi:exosome complex RNA-binding protein Rrp42 (RNase PH superfamily)